MSPSIPPDENEASSNDSSDESRETTTEITEFPPPTESEKERSELGLPIDPHREPRRRDSSVESRREQRNTFASAILPSSSEMNSLFNGIGAIDSIQNNLDTFAFSQVSDFTENPFIGDFVSHPYESTIGSSAFGAHTGIASDIGTLVAVSPFREYGLSESAFGAFQMDLFEPVQVDAVNQIGIFTDEVFTHQIIGVAGMIEPVAVSDFLTGSDILTASDFLHTQELGVPMSAIEQTRTDLMADFPLELEQTFSAASILDDIFERTEPQVHTPAHELENQFFDSLAGSLAFYFPYEKEVQQYVYKIKIANDVIDKRQAFMNLYYGAKDGATTLWYVIGHLTKVYTLFRIFFF